jgi:uncharacterized protein YjiK
MRSRGLALLLACATASGCHAPKNSLDKLQHSDVATARLQRLQKTLADHEAAIDGTPIAKWIMPAPLREISGLALTPDGRLLAHGDESGEIWEIDYRTGILVKHFFLGEPTAKGDFEAITVANDLVYLLDSKGKIYSFKEGADGARVKYNYFDSDLKKDCEFESMVYDARFTALVLACKHVHDASVHDAIVLYRLSLATNDTTSHVVRMEVPLGTANGGKSYHPSDITIDPVSGNYVLVSSLEKALIAITPTGELVFSRPLPPGHEQPEGVAITKDGILLVSDESKANPGAITLYKWP